MTSQKTLWIRFWDIALWFIIIGVLLFDYQEEIKSIALFEKYQVFLDGFIITWLVLVVTFVVYTFIHLMCNKEVENKLIWALGFICGGFIIASVFYYGIHIKKVMYISKDFPYIKSFKYDDKYGTKNNMEDKSANDCCNAIDTSPTKTKTDSGE